MSGKIPVYTQHNCVRGSGLHSRTRTIVECGRSRSVLAGKLKHLKRYWTLSGNLRLHFISAVFQRGCHLNWPRYDAGNQNINPGMVSLLKQHLTPPDRDYIWLFSLDLISTPISWRGSRSFLSCLSQRTKRSTNSPKRGGKVWCLSAASTTCCCSIEERTLKEMLSSKMCTPFSRHSQELKQNVSCGNRIYVEKGRGYIMEMNGIMHCLK